MHAVRCILTLLMLASATEAIAQNRDRNKMVLNDRQRVVEDGYWIYNNLDKATEQAKQTGKPILVVFRCIPCEACAQLDEQVVEKNPAVRKHLSNFVCVRIVHTNGMDLSRFQFDYDQSWAAFFLNADGNIYGRYGTRSHQHESEDDVSLDGFLDSMQHALALHAKYPEVKDSLKAKFGPKPVVAHPEEFPLLKEKYTSSLNYGPEVARSCIHCHQVGDALRNYYWRDQKPMPTELLFPYPHPKILGLIMDPKKAVTVKEVADNSAAMTAGFQAGDKITSLEGQPLISVADIQWVLHQRKEAGQLHFQVNRNGATKEIALSLPENWKEQGDISWRVGAWEMCRMVTGGLRLEALTSDERTAQGLAQDAIGLKVRFVGQFNDHATGKKAGFKVDDVITEIDSVAKPMTESQLFAHLIRTKKPGEKVQVKLLRGGKALTLELPIQL